MIMMVILPGRWGGGGGRLNKRSSPSFKHVYSPFFRRKIKDDASQRIMTCINVPDELVVAKTV